MMLKSLVVFMVKTVLWSAAIYFVSAPFMESGSSVIVTAQLLWVVATTAGISFLIASGDGKFLFGTEIYLWSLIYLFIGGANFYYLGFLDGLVMFIVQGVLLGLTAITFYLLGARFNPAQGTAIPIGFGN